MGGPGALWRVERGRAARAPAASWTWETAVAYPWSGIRSVRPG